MQLKKSEPGYVPFDNPPRHQRRQRCSPSSAESWQLRWSVGRSEKQSGETYRASRHPKAPQDTPNVDDPQTPKTPETHKKSPQDPQKNPQDPQNVDHPQTPKTPETHKKAHNTYRKPTRPTKKAPETHKKAHKTHKKPISKTQSGNRKTLTTHKKAHKRPRNARTIFPTQLSHKKHTNTRSAPQNKQRP
jgi:hypothetical protein